MKRDRTEDITLESTLKSVDTEEVFDLIFYRPGGYRLALFFRRLGVVPNVVTSLSLLISIGAGVLFYFSGLSFNIAGIFLLVIAHFLDCADGQLARMTGKFSRFGSVFDRLGGCLSFFVIYLVLCFRLINVGWDVSIFFLALIAGYFHLRQSATVDYYRNFHLFILKGKSGNESELEERKQLQLNLRRLSWRDSFIQKMFLLFNLQYTILQERFTPDMQEFRAIIRCRYNDNIPDWLKLQFREKSLRLMKYTNFLSFNIRVIVLFVSLLSNEVWIYFVFELSVLNGVLFYVTSRYERLSRYFVEKLCRE